MLIRRLAACVPEGFDVWPVSATHEERRRGWRLDLTPDMIGGMAPASGPPGRRGWRLVQDAVGRAVDAEDPEGLLSAGAPADEYTTEVQALVGLVLKGPVTAEGVLTIWERWFGPDSGLVRSPARLDRLTGKLVEIRRRHVPD